MNCDDDSEWVEYPKKVFDEIQWDTLKKGFLLGVGFSVIMFFVFIIGIISSKK